MEKASIHFFDVVSLNTGYNLLKAKQDEAHKKSAPALLANRHR